MLKYAHPQNAIQKTIAHQRIESPLQGFAMGLAWLPKGINVGNSRAVA